MTVQLTILRRFELFCTVIERTRIRSSHQIWRLDPAFPTFSDTSLTGVGGKTPRADHSNTTLNIY
ncbi:hypothetical protein [Lyngbya sp. PCC 8106]|uniref:hypothetical protein n=1 Tax=Lyngbya sp. (strain PCC 8106) TaxID=313612 RepID=UPI0012EAC5DC|nr:hypothetical protein [Lyngbya sp. PCC 8106]